MKGKIKFKKIIEYIAIGGALVSTAFAFALCPYSGIKLIGAISLCVLGFTRHKEKKNEKED